MHDQPESTPVSIPPLKSVVDDGVQTAGGFTLKIPHVGHVTFKQPRPGYDRLQRLIEKDPCLKKLRAKLAAVHEYQTPSDKDCRLAWKEVEAAFSRFMDMKYQTEWVVETRKVLEAEIARRKIIIRDKEESRVGHRIRQHLGSRYHRFSGTAIPTEKPKVRINLSATELRVGNPTSPS